MRPLVPPTCWQTGYVQGALNLPVSSLRKRMGEVPEGKKLYVYCQVVGGSARVHSAACFCCPVRAYGHAHFRHSAGGTRTRKAVWLSVQLSDPAALRSWTRSRLRFEQTSPPHSQVGQRGYYAYRQLSLAGHEAVNVSGGWKSAADFKAAGIAKL